MSGKINKPSMKPILRDAVQRLIAEGPSAVSDSVFTVIADHVRSALEGSRAIVLEEVEHELKSFFREALAAVPKEARSAVQGTGDPESMAAFLLGQAAFAHLLTARTLDTRVDQRFIEAIEDKRYEKYFRALLGGAKDGVTLARITAETAETVSRKLSALREMRLVVARHEGKRVVNKLSPAAKALLDHRGVEALSETEGEGTDIGRKLAELQEEAPPSLRELPVLGDRSNKKVA